MKRPQTDKFLCLFLPLLSLQPLLSALYPGYYKVNSWQISEWLINYQGGFVRRGLPGEIILALGKLGINPYLSIIGLSFSIWLLLVLVLLKLSAHRSFPPLVICSQLCMLAPVISQQIVRKDCLIVLIFILALYFFQKSGPTSVLLGNSISALAVLSHEVYGFVSVPAFFVIKYVERDESLSSETGRSSRRVNHRDRFIYAVTCISPLLALFALCLAYKGNPSIAHRVWNSWQNQLQFFPGSSNLPLADPPAAIDALGRSLAWTSKYVLSTFGDFSLGIYVPVAWVATMALVAFYLLLLYRSHLITLQVADSEAKDQLLCFAQILSLQLFAILPVCVVSWDFGRLIFLWATSSVSFFLVLTPGRQLAVSSLVSDAISLLPRTVRHSLGIIRIAYARALASAFVSSRRLALAKLFLLLFGIPVCCWSVVQYLTHTPLAQPFWYAITRPW